MKDEKSIKFVSIDNCTFVKTILMLCVMIGHCMNFWNGTWFTVIIPKYSSDNLANLSIWLNSFHIYAFALVSGYLYHFLRHEKNKYSEFTPFVLAKAKRLLIPYCFCAAIWIIPITTALYSYSARDILVKYILCTSPSQLWFLWMLFWVFIMVWPLSKLLKNDIVAILISVVSWTIGLVGNMILPNVFCIWTAFTYLPYFVFGMKLREKKDWFLYRIPSGVYLVIQILLFILWQSLSSRSGAVAKILSLGLEYVVHVFGALAAFFVLQWLATKVNWKESKAFMFLSQRSMPIYLFHQQVIYFTIIWLNGKVNPYINATVNFIVAMAVSILISSILMKFKATRFLIGEKCNPESNLSKLFGRSIKSV